MTSQLRLFRIDLEVWTRSIGLQSYLVHTNSFARAMDIVHHRIVNQYPSAREINESRSWEYELSHEFVLKGADHLETGKPLKGLMRV